MKKENTNACLIPLSLWYHTKNVKEYNATTMIYITFQVILENYIEDIFTSNFQCFTFILFDIGLTFATMIFSGNYPVIKNELHIYAKGSVKKN